MEKFAQRENVLLGYSPKNDFGNQSSSPKTPLKDPDIDFHDVFGGPPRRFSMQEMRYSFTETVNSTDNTTPGEDGRVLPRNPWSGLNEMPVFGEETVNRRRYTSDDFFDDIFRVGESPRSNHDPSRSTPGSRVLSPARPLPSRADPFGNFQFSLPAKLTKALDFPAFASGNRSPYKYKDPTSNGINSLYTPSSPLSRCSSEAFQEDDELRNEIQQYYRPSPLSHEFSLNNKEPSCITKSGELESTDKGGNLKKDLKSTEAPSNSSRFHFSIYKWATKGVSMPLRGGNSPKSKERVKTKRCSSSNGRIQGDYITNNELLQAANGHDFDLHFLNHSVSANNESPYPEGRNQDRDSLLKTSNEDKVEPCHIVEDTVLSMLGSISINKISNTVKTVAADAILSDKRKEIKPHSLSKTGFVEITEKGIATGMQEAQKSELNPPRSLLNDTDEGQGNDEIIRKFEGKDSMVKNITVSDSNADISKNIKKRDEKRINSKKAEVIQEKELHSQDSSRTSGDNLGRNGGKGKVKEFVKIFNEEATSQPKNDIKTRSQSSRWRSTGTFGADNEGSANITQKNGKNHVHSVDKMKAPPNDSFKVDKNLEELEKQQSHSKSRVFIVSENSFGQKDASASSSESLPDDSKVAVGNIDDLFQENFVVKELSNDQDKPRQTEDGYKNIQISEAKIWQWSNGKEGNIRSLLSTLQYVLWPGSGWKPVPLVDIIEGSAVKRAYQKALLCLHPDKLQQKGAAFQQKYIAEKVFDILQESWDHFNSLGVI